MGRTVSCPAGQRTAIFQHRFVQMPWSWTVRFRMSDGAIPAGEVIEQRSTWIFPDRPLRRPLEAVMTFERGWWNTFYTVYIEPERDVIAEIE